MDSPNVIESSNVTIKLGHQLIQASKLVAEIGYFRPVVYCHSTYQYA